MEKQIDQSRLRALTTEGRNPNTMAIDTATAEEIVRMINNEDKTVACASAQSRCRRSRRTPAVRGCLVLMLPRAGACAAD